jgi:hypothetical protein
VLLEGLAHADEALGPRQAVTGVAPAEDEAIALGLERRPPQAMGSRHTAGPFELSPVQFDIRTGNYGWQFNPLPKVRHPCRNRSPAPTISLARVGPGE